MKKLLIVMLIAGMGITSMSANAYTNVIYDFSGIKIDSQAKLSQYPFTYLGWKTVVQGYSPGWNGVPLPKLAQGLPNNLDASSPDSAVTSLNVGLTQDSGASFSPVMPGSCKVEFKKDHSYVLKVFGVLYAPGEHKAAYIEHLSCQLIQK